MRQFITLLVLVFSLTNSYSQEIDSIFNRIFRPTIKTVQLFPKLSDRQNEIHAPAISLKQQTHLELRFDDLAAEPGYYNLKIVHCNRDWKPSQLVSTDYLNEYNEFQIEDQNLSFNTQTQYVHYHFNIPRVLRSGNYGIIVYDQDTEEIVLMRRFIVFEERLKVLLNANYTSLRSAKGLQSFDYKIDFQGKNLDTPSEAINVVMKQNGRWDNAVDGLQPTFVNDNELIYDYDDENVFIAGNEFRFFDIKSFRYRTQNVKENIYDSVNHVILNRDIKRN